LGLSAGDGTSEPPLVNYLMAQRINQASGGAFVAPWEVDQLPDEWIDAASALVDDLPGMMQSRQQVKAVVDKWRNSSTAYRKR
jgi:hypothetical protein